MHGFRFDTEQDYQRFLTAYQQPKKRTNKGQGGAIFPPSRQIPTDAAKKLLQAILAAGLPGLWCREFTFHEQREFRLDIACVDGRKIGCEVDGMVHRIKKNFLRDIDKHNLLILTGWRYLRVTPAQVENGEALVLLTALLESTGV